jgi:hypothetical protein
LPGEREDRLFETSASRVYLVRQEGAALSGPEREALLAGLRHASRNGPVAVVLDVGPLGSVGPDDAAWWLAVLEDREADVGAVAVVTGARSVRLATLAFSAVVSLRHLPVEVKAVPDDEAAIGWAAGALGRAAAARKRASQAPIEPLARP